MKKILLTIFCIATLHAFAGQDTLKYRICLTDKAATAYTLDNPEAFLSPKAIARRVRQHLTVDSTDLPVCRTYIEAIREKGVHIVVTGKWENFVTVSCNDTTCIDSIAKLPFVKSVEKVWTISPPGKKRKEATRKPLADKPQAHENPYGAGYTQLAMCGGDRLHEAGFRGEGKTIAVMDAGFHNVDCIAAFDSLQLLGIKDFVGHTPGIFLEGDHGLKVLSCMAANEPHIMIGTAPKASYWLFRTEDEYSEHLVEQDYWAAAVEFADSVGVDLINTSLGYTKFDDPSKDYRLRDLDGKFSLMSRQASRVADKGMVLVCSAGNSGQGSWKKITPPADAYNVLAVGAVHNNGKLATFSSVGNTTDNRIKPDVMAMGAFARVIAPNGTPASANGTSFATPILCGMVACLWQARPELTAKEVMELVRQSGDRADYPDNIFGYGVPDLWKAYLVQPGTQVELSD